MRALAVLAVLCTLSPRGHAVHIIEETMTDLFFFGSVTMDPEEEEKVDYSVDKLLNDASFQEDVLTKIAKLGDAVEKALKSPQDIEGVVKDGKLYMVQTRPQM